ncbi:hypothetical protein MF271_04410 [Deinococcus sp. KNUC1210]|uniref:hypothetical protein n=1 Tax=Deinococcus sp. KNUC1210 TaxID=2917691 RepID=UPI001EF091C8|nr:hypothetical protein [Deinococcus sp. KNUC1210]ULH15878.1 hypothetical protein MF271_04410 [Deinococcus sp. KNUC1210]
MTQSTDTARPTTLPFTAQAHPEEVFGEYVFEVTADTQAIEPVQGWTLRLWPQARLGDGTLEASTQGGTTLHDLLNELEAQHVRPLGPIHFKKHG